MRRMYSEKELQEIIHEVVGDYIEDGAFDDSIAEAVDAYLEENPIDITALEGLDISVGSLDADGLVTGAEIVEKMSGYSFTKNTALTWSPIYVGAVKTGNKLTFVVFGTYTYATGDSAQLMGTIKIPDSVGNKLYPFSYGGENTYLHKGELPLFNTANAYEKPKIASFDVQKSSNTTLYLNFRNLNDSSLEDTKTYLFRVEITFLLSDSLAS